MIAEFILFITFIKGYREFKSRHCSMEIILSHIRSLVFFSLNQNFHLVMLEVVSGLFYFIELYSKILFVSL